MKNTCSVWNLKLKLRTKFIAGLALCSISGISHVSVVWSWGIVLHQWFEAWLCHVILKQARTEEQKEMLRQSYSPYGSRIKRKSKGVRQARHHLIYSSNSSCLLLSINLSNAIKWWVNTLMKTLMVQSPPKFLPVNIALGTTLSTHELWMNMSYSNHKILSFLQRLIIIMQQKCICSIIKSLLILIFVQ